MPDQADALARPMQGFLKDTLTGLYVDELGREMNVLADPDDTGPDSLVDRQEQRLARSGDLSDVNTAAYVLARDPARQEHGGIVGLAKFVRNGEAEVEIDELDVALDRRGERIGPALIDEALGTLAIAPRDRLTLDVLAGNERAKAFWSAIGFSYTGRQHRYVGIFPNAADYHLEMSAPEPLVHHAVRERLRATNE